MLRMHFAKIYPWDVRVGGYIWYSVWIAGSGAPWQEFNVDWWGWALAFRNLHHILQYPVEYFCGYHRRWHHIITIFFILGTGEGQERVGVGGCVSLPSGGVREERGLSTSTRCTYWLGIANLFFFLFSFWILHQESSSDIYINLLLLLWASIRVEWSRGGCLVQVVRFRFRCMLFLSFRYYERLKESRRDWMTSWQGKMGLCGVGADREGVYCTCNSFFVCVCVCVIKWISILLW